MISTQKNNARSILGENIRRHRERLGISQECLAELSGLHRTYIGGIERGERNVSIDNIEKIAKALGVQVFELFIGQNEKD